MRYLQPVVVLLALPALIGMAAEQLLHEIRRASIFATLATLVAVYACLRALEPDETWSWLAALLVSPLTIAIALATVIVCCGHAEARRRPRRPS